MFVKRALGDVKHTATQSNSHAQIQGEHLLPARLRPAAKPRRQLSFPASAYIPHRSSVLSEPRQVFEASVVGSGVHPAETFPARSYHGV
jgi:hypothetical protein